MLVGANLRTIRSIVDSISKVPAVDRKHVIESITGSILPKTISAEEWIRNNRNRWVFLLAGTTIILIAVVAAVAVFQPAGPGPQPPVEVGRLVAGAWLKKIDSGEMADAYLDTYEGFRSDHTQASWLEMASIYRTPLGKVEQRIDAGSFPDSRQLNGVHLNFHVFKFLTKFENLTVPIEELVTITSPGLPSPWRPAGYIVNVPPDAPFLMQSVAQ